MKNNKEIYTFKMIKLDDILKTGDMNIRKVDDLADLKASIKEHGIINPVTVTKIADGYQLLAGFRRCWAAAQLGMEKVPCHVYEADEKLLKEIPVTENICRLNMSPAEECLAVAHLVNNKNTPKTVARKFGKSLRWVLIRKKIADAGEKAIEKLESGDLELAAAAKLADLPDEEFKKVIEENPYITSSNVDDILEDFHLDLDKAPFEHSKCLKCEKCSACQTDLFDDDPKAYCLDPSCFQKKVREAAKKKVKELQDEGRTVRLGNVHSWGLDHDDEDYDHELRSYMTKFKEAEEAGIQKRVIVNPENCQVFEYYDERDLPGYVEETQEEIDARHEEENRERKMNGIRFNMYKDKMQAAIEKLCRTNMDALVTLMFLNSDDEYGLLSDDVLPMLGIGDEGEDENLSTSIWDTKKKLTPPDFTQAVKDSLSEWFGNIYYSEERMEFTYRLILGKDPSKLKPSEEAVQKEYDRQEAEGKD